MSKYEIRISWSEVDQAYIAQVPELAGCMANGSTYSEALTNVERVAAEWLETARSLSRSVPVPKPLMAREVA
jgi:predicted RNase H-like HicB family nuclease